MPLYLVLALLAAAAAGLLAATAATGITLEGQASMYRHYIAGMGTSMFACFIHVLVLFYLIGTGKDIREAVEEDPELAARYLSWTRRQKRRVFPAACFSLVTMVLATLMGGEVHSRLLAAGRGAALPLREVPGWWVHGVLVGAALLVNGWAFWVEVATVRDNRRAILELNSRLLEKNPLQTPKNPVGSGGS